MSLKRLDRGNTERELDRLIEAQTAALGPCRVERVLPQHFFGLRDRPVKLFLFPRAEDAPKRSATPAKTPSSVAASLASPPARAIGAMPHEALGNLRDVSHRPGNLDALR